ncbi:MAG: hypothetical protein JRI89_14690 [Deltaproteobacteria bacterium]|nr:hypothetical protein [Deltaproteobacteria bacterium]
MTLSWLLYNIATLPLAAVLAPLPVVTRLCSFQGRGGRWRQRFGSYPAAHIPPGRANRPRLWIHAVSVGEVGVAATLIQALDEVLPGLDLVLSTTTSQGQQVAAARLPQRVRRIYFPLDLLYSVAPALRRVRPDLIVCLETELWPNFLACASHLDIPAVLLNGRISERSFARYLRLRPFLAPVLQGFAALAMVSDADAARITAMGAPPERVVVSGNLKNVDLLQRAVPARVDKLRQTLQLTSREPVLVAGSIRAQELAWLPEVYLELQRQVPELVAIFAPRHLQRLPRLQRWLRDHDLAYQLYSRLIDGGETRKAGVILVDRMGALFDLYGLADVVFCGGSLIPLGGQNILEPAAWGKPVFYGPHMENFAEARTLLESAGCGWTVADKQELLHRLQQALARPQEFRDKAARGRQLLQGQQHIAIQQARIVREVIKTGTWFKVQGASFRR